VQFVEIGEDLPDVVERVGTLGVASELNPLPIAQICVEVFAHRRELLLQPFDLGREIDLIDLVELTQLQDLGL
jgi:hypothetical protein